MKRVERHNAWRRAVQSLRELQQGFAAAMNGRTDTLRPAVDGRALGAEARIGIYRHAIAATRLRALRDTYPVVCALVGDAFFERLADRYATRHPSRCGDLCVYGAELCDFIAQMPEAVGPVPYLADIARLEWLRQEAALAADAEPVSDSRCLSRDAIDPDRVRATLHPSLRLIRSPFPILTIHRWCETPTEPTPRLEDGPECGLIWRSGDQVAESVIHPANHAFIEALRDGCTVAEGAATAWLLDADFAVGKCLTDLLDRGLIIEFPMKENIT